MKTPTAQAPSVGHYENFPVASWLCPPALRPAIAAIYGFARSADDLADEGNATAEQRLAALARYRADLQAVALDPLAETQAPAVFKPLAQVIHSQGLPLKLLDELLQAFEQDVRMSARHGWYRDRAELLDYCRRSANPVGRLLLHLYGLQEPLLLKQSDQICSALQLINFWQDLSLDLPRGRYYLPLDRCAQYGVSTQDLMGLRDNGQARELIESEVRWARETMLAGAPLALRLPGRIGWELRLVVQGGLRILDKIERGDFRTLQWRPRLRPWDLLPMAWRALRM